MSGIAMVDDLRTMFRIMTPANNLRFHRGTDSPAIRVERFTVAGT